MAGLVSPSRVYPTWASIFSQLGHARVADAIHVFTLLVSEKTWMPGTRPGMTAERVPMDDKTRTELEAAVYRRLVEHLRGNDVQNIDLMNLAGFCRNCLSNWMKDAADAKGLTMSKDESREIVYGMPYDAWRAKNQKDATPEQKAAFEASQKH
jgi:hypothetical protein